MSLRVRHDIFEFIPLLIYIIVLPFGLASFMTCHYALRLVSARSFVLLFPIAPGNYP